MSRQCVAAGAIALVVGIAITLTVGPSPWRRRPLGVEYLRIADREIPAGGSDAVTLSWDPPTDIIVTGWAFRSGDGPGVLYLHRDGEMLISGGHGLQTTNPAEFPGGGFLVRRGKPLSLSYVARNNKGPTVQTGPIWARIYYLPAD
jgi:hypothetical protein